MKILLPFSVFLLFTLEQIEGNPHYPAPMLGIVDALERKTEHKGTEVRSLVGDACSIVAWCVYKGRICPCSRK
jgi:hypothetical protein